MASEGGGIILHCPLSSSYKRQANQLTTRSFSHYELLSTIAVALDVLEGRSQERNAGRVAYSLCLCPGSGCVGVGCTRQA
eukprot:scaffold1326_cov130-Skeletonema_dohrnii-CCMP3373.AAC.2